MKREFLLNYTSLRKDYAVEIFRDEREEGEGFYVDFRKMESDIPEGCLYFSDNLTNCVTYAKTIVCHYDSFEDLLEEHFGYEMA